MGHYFLDTQYPEVRLELVWNALIWGLVVERDVHQNSCQFNQTKDRKIYNSIMKSSTRIHNHIGKRWHDTLQTLSPWTLSYQGPWGGIIEYNYIYFMMLYCICTFYYNFTELLPEKEKPRIWLSRTELWTHSGQ